MSVNYIFKGPPTSLFSSTGGTAISLGVDVINARLYFRDDTSADGNVGWQGLGVSTIAWNSLGNATGSLTLANAGFATTFNQTSAVNWTWANTTAATNALSQSSPILNISGQYWTGSASAADSWAIQSSNGNGTNGAPSLVFTHTGSATAGSVTFAGNTSIKTGNWLITSLAINGTTTLALQSQASGWGVALSGNIGAQATAITLGNQVNYAATSGTQVGVLIGSDSNSNAKNTFAPASGTANFVGLQVAPTINQTGTASGNYTVLLINPTQTALLGSATSSKLLDVQIGSSSQFNIDTQGHIIGSANTRGSISSASGTTVSVTFTNAFVGTPFIQVTPTTNAGAYFLSAVSNTGFTITYATTGAQTFNWIAIG